MLLGKDGYMQKKIDVGDFVVYENGDIKDTLLIISKEDHDGDMIGLLVDGEGWNNRCEHYIDDEAYNNILDSNYKHLFKEGNIFGWYISRNSYRYRHIPKIRKTRLALKMVPKEDIFKETEDFIWVKNLN